MTKSFILTCSQVNAMGNINKTPFFAYADSLCSQEHTLLLGVYEVCPESIRPRAL